MASEVRAESNQEKFTRLSYQLAFSANVLIAHSQGHFSLYCHSTL